MSELPDMKTDITCQSLFIGLGAADLEEEEFRDGFVFVTTLPLESTRLVSSSTRQGHTK